MNTQSQCCNYPQDIWLIVRDIRGNWHITKNEFEFGLPMFTEAGYETKTEAKRRLSEIIKHGEIR